MNRPPAPERLAARGLLATVEIITLASLAHVLAGGRLPAPGFLLAFGCLVFGGALLTISRVIHLAVVVPFVGLSQIGLHAALDVSGSHAAMAMHGSGSIFSVTGPMLWAHVATTILTAIVLLLQERVLEAVVAALELPAPSVPLLRTRSRSVLLARPGRRVLLATSPRRGPPRLLLATS